MDLDPLPASKAPTVYRCPMHPAQQSLSPGTCPICKMDLEPLRSPPPGTAPLRLSLDRQQSIGVRTAEARALTRTPTLRAPATLELAESGAAQVHVRAAGFLEKIAVAETGVRVHRGQRLADDDAALDDLGGELGAVVGVDEVDEVGEVVDLGVGEGDAGAGLGLLGGVVGLDDDARARGDPEGVGGAVAGEGAALGVEDAAAEGLDLDGLDEVAFGASGVVFALQHLQLAQAAEQGDEGEDDEQDHGLQPGSQLAEVLGLTEVHHAGLAVAIGTTWRWRGGGGG